MKAILTDNVEGAAEAVGRGGIVVVATETFYCVAANPFCAEAVKRVYMLKGRPMNKPLPLIASEIENVSGVISEESVDSLELGLNFWPGSLTVLMKLKVRLPECLQDQSERVAVRVPPDCPARRLARLSGGWITATSANLSGGANAASVKEISSVLLDSVDYVVDSGLSPGGMPSTVVALESGQPLIYRLGAVSPEALEMWMKDEFDKST